MTQAAREVLTAFEALPPTERQQVAAEILRRSTTDGELSDAALCELADDLFCRYDREEADRARP